MQKYEVGVYNKFIRDKVRDGEIVGQEESGQGHQRTEV